MRPNRQLRHFCTADASCNAHVGRPRNYKSHNRVGAAPVEGRRSDSTRIMDRIRITG